MNKFLVVVSVIVSVFVTVVMPFASTFVGALSAHWFTARREKVAELKKLLQQVNRASHEHKDATIWLFSAERSAACSGGDERRRAKRKLRAIQQRSRTYENLLFWESDLEIQIGDEGKPLREAMNELRDHAPNPGLEWMTGFDEVATRLRRVSDEIGSLLRAQQPETLVAKGKRCLRWLDQASRLPPY